ncbi:MAG: hypothetical protein LQ340_007171 [Diploschistes diacapsis]|nr:MAG: hypothetical protein LQ340_007171 [Diploschistes diacapsis]
MEPSAAAFQIIVLGGGGGPIEDDVVGLLVRSTATGWAKNSVLAVDAGVHLSGIVRILDDHLPGSNRQKPSEASSSTGGPRWGSPIPQSQTDTPKLVMTTGPFRGLLMPSETAKANAHHLLRNFITTYLITHPHLDHLSGFAINTAAFQHTTRPKKLAALPSTINAFKQHIFNDVVWPNLSDEEGGAGLVSFQRLTEGGNLALGDGEGIGYIEVCDGLAVKAWGVSHGKCMKQHTSRSSVSPNQDFSFGPSSTNSDRRGIQSPQILPPR